MITKVMPQKILSLPYHLFKELIMSNNAFPVVELLQNSTQHLKELVSRTNSDLLMERESNYLFQVIRDNHNDMFAKNSLQRAISSCDPYTVLNCVELGLEMGLSFNPTRDFLYLIPRFNKALNGFECTLMVGYKGYKQLAANSGCFSRIDTHLVYSNDDFQYNGPDEKVSHRYNSFATNDRGELVGGYCMAKLKTKGMEGEYIVTVMTKDELLAVEQQAVSNSTGFSVWNSKFKMQMYLKTLIRRAFKDWEYVIAEHSHQGNARQILDNVQTLNDMEEKLVAPEQSNAEMVLTEQRGEHCA